MYYCKLLIKIRKKIKKIPRKFYLRSSQRVPLYPVKVQSQTSGDEHYVILVLFLDQYKLTFPWRHVGLQTAIGGKINEKIVRIMTLTCLT